MQSHRLLHAVLDETMNLNEEHWFAVRALRYHLIDHLALRRWADRLIAASKAPADWMLDLCLVSAGDAAFLLEHLPIERPQSPNTWMAICALLERQAAFDNIPIDSVVPIVADLLYESEHEIEPPSLRSLYNDLCYVDELFRDCGSIDTVEYRRRMLSRLSAEISEGVNIPDWVFPA